MSLVQMFIYMTLKTNKFVKIKNKESSMNKKSNQPRPVTIMVSCIFIATLLLIALRVISYGYIPSDDVMRHVAKVVSGKSWGEILVLRPEITMDSHVGWHKLLEFLYQMTGCSIDNLAVFSIVFLFILFCIVPLFFLKRPEAWLIALLIIWVANYFALMRIFLGRPYIFTMAVVVFLGFVWPRFKEKSIPWPSVMILTALIALATWIHCLWYMFALPVLCFFVAREWRAGFVVSGCAIAGVVIGMLMTGHPIQFFLQTMGHFFHSLGDHTFTGQLVTEFQPFNGDVVVVMVVLGMLGWRAFRNSWDLKAIYTPVFILAAVSWVLGFLVLRVWVDWGIPAVCVWMALEFEEYLKISMDSSSWKRAGLTLAIACILFIAVTNDYRGRWTQNMMYVQYLSADKPEHKKWLPEKGGIVYNDDMMIFYETFYSNPHADWRYILGFEPTMMPPGDLAVLRKIQWFYGASEAYEPWVKKMRPEDRLILRRHSMPDIKELEWNLTVPGVWIGRLPKQKPPL